MRIRCQACGSEFGSHQVAAGVTTMLPAAALTGALAGVFIRRLPVLVALGTLPSWMLLSWVLWECPRWLTRAWYAFHRCPRCGACEWGRPFYSGFGL